MLARIQRRVLEKVARWQHAPGIKVHRADNLIRLGSRYGGWKFQPSSDLDHSTILSCGLGEDASFDVEFASRFSARVIIVDPTPRAIVHFGEIQLRVGQAALQPYVEGGKQPATSYDLSRIDKGALILEPSALWTENTRLRFYAPPNPNHVSHSIVNYQNSYAEDTAHIEVPAVTLESLIDKYALTSIPLMKLDIEGAEIPVINQMLEKSIRPRQMLVEFDEMNSPCDRSKKNAEDTDRLLRSAGYECRDFDGLANFLYVLR